MSGTCFLEEIRHLQLRLCDHNISFWYMLCSWEQAPLLSARQTRIVTVLCLLQMHLPEVQEMTQVVYMFPFPIAKADEEPELLKGSLVTLRAYDGFLPDDNC